MSSSTTQPSTAPYTLIGTPFSTFTRTISLGLQHKSLPYTQLATKTQTPLAKANHPFGYLPTLIIHDQEIDDEGRKGDIKLRESHAIVRYIDRVKPEPSLQLEEGEGGVAIPEKMWEFVSFVAFFGFPILEGGVIKPRVKALDEGKLTDAEVRSQIAEGVLEAKKFLALIESLMAPSPSGSNQDQDQDGGYIFGDKLTWADFFLYPIFADFRMIPEWKEIVSERLVRWTEKMDLLEAVRNTRAGTLEVGARPV
ncbi:hypothetical protein CVT26_012309 [Gymnopilus dilepis]|uniref:GST N-terminal domain-containing protein n=1 Tax=Gymnopilus dilepis TaxID=231916 RepID=A0A409WML6_9AGAR|nr:hypothetical protein CVT26_012309 [Gymnopilus dilepis]